MAHSKFFKERLKRKLTKDLKKFGIAKISANHEAVIFNYSQIFWDFRMELRTHNIVIILEIETKRPDPVNNLIKTLVWLDENTTNIFFIFLHFFDSSYGEIYTPANDICTKLWEKFLIKSCKEKMVYSQHLIGDLAKASGSKRKTKELYPVYKRISQITERVVSTTIKKIEASKK